jgi:hypothetical protein
MAAIAHASRVNTTNQTTTSSTYVDATNGDIASGNFTTGDKYLILAMAQLGVDTSFKGGYTRIEVAPPFKTEIAARISGSLHDLSRRRERQ